MRHEEAFGRHTGDAPEVSRKWWWVRWKMCVVGGMCAEGGNTKMIASTKA